MASLQLFLLALASFVANVAGNLGVAVRRAAARNGQGAASAVVPPSSRGPWVVELQRFAARPIQGALGSDVSSFYVGEVAIGQPAQTLQVLFDTSSGQVIVPHRACKSAACEEHRRYSPWQSFSSSDVNGNGTLVQRYNRLAHGKVTREGATILFSQADLGEGEAKGVFVRDQVCLVEGACSYMSLLAATTLDDTPFRAMPHDGIVGLSLTGLSCRSSFNFVHQWFARFPDVPRQFGLSLDRNGGQLYFGGYDQSRLAAPLQWFPVVRPSDGFWQVRIHTVRAGNVTLDACAGGCRGVVDTGASRLGVLPNKVSVFREVLSSTPTMGRGCQGPILEFDLGIMQLMLGPQDYASPTCTPQLGVINLEEPKFEGVYALGETVLRRYYAAFDWEAQAVGFAPASRAVTGMNEVDRIVV